jgi:hypothetical protein
MAKRLSLHIGLNEIDERRYGSPGTLYGCINDANAMQRVAEDRNFTTDILINEKATIDAVLEHLKSDADQLSEGDYYFLTYSGHGGQIPDLDGEERDKLDETWCLYDMQMADDMLYGALVRFAPGVRVFILSDSCHSGTVTRNLVATVTTEVAERRDAARKPRSKRLPLAVTKAEYANHEAEYQQKKELLQALPRPAADAQVILISGCKDDQESLDGDENGAFTTEFLDIWQNGAFTGNFVGLHGELHRRLDPTGQTPVLFPYGTNVGEMKRQIPLSDTAQPSD